MKIKLTPCSCGVDDDEGGSKDDDDGVNDVDDDDDNDFAGCYGAPCTEASILEVAAESHPQQVR